MRWSFTGFAAKPRFTRSLVEDCRLEPLASGGTAISYTMYLDPPAVLKPFMNLAARQIRRNNTRALQNLATRAAGLVQ